MDLEADRCGAAIMGRTVVSHGDGGHAMRAYPFIVPLWIAAAAFIVHLVRSRARRAAIRREMTHRINCYLRRTAARTINRKGG